MLAMPSKLSVESFLIDGTQSSEVSNGAPRPGMGRTPLYNTMPIGAPKGHCTDIPEASVGSFLRGAKRRREKPWQSHKLT
jgi:hypothetical protein